MRATPTGLATLTKAEHDKVAARFWSKVRKGEPGECWEWTGGCFYDGYGQFKIKLKNCKAHRVAHELIFGEPNYALKLLHNCDNKRCCNPDHLEVGTQLKNILDMLDRSAPGANRKLDADDVRYIRRSKQPRAILAAMYGVGKQMITDVRTGRRWGHIQ